MEASCVVVKVWVLPTWHGAQPRRTRKSEMVHLISPPLQFTKQQTKKVWKDLDPVITVYINPPHVSYMLIKLPTLNAAHYRAWELYVNQDSHTECWTLTMPHVNQDSLTFHTVLNKIIIKIPLENPAHEWQQCL